MELRHLHYFVAAAETLNFHKAAERLHVTQPSVSQQVRELEQELGLELFVRDLSRVRLTDHGRLLLTRANAVLREIRALVEAMSPSDDVPAGTLNLGVDIALAKRVQGIIREYARRYPRVEIQCYDNYSSGLHRSLQTGEVDVAFVWSPPARGLVSQRVFDERFSAVVPKASPLAKRKQLLLTDLSGQVLLLPRPTNAFNLRVLRLCREAGVRFKVRYTQTFPHEAGVALVESGRGIYVYPQVAVTMINSQKGIAIVPLHRSLSMTVYMAWRKGETSAVACKFLECARRHVTAFAS
jgi:DNA-binding transcriptional LysR family regulator